MPPKRKAAESATERTTKTRRASAKEAPVAKPSKSATTTKKGTKDNAKATTVSSALDPDTFTLERVQAMFDKYIDEDDSNVIGAEGMERLCTDASVPMDGALPLLITWSVNAKTLGTITRSEFTDSFGKLKIDTPEKMALMASDLNSLFFGCNISEQASRMSLANSKLDSDSYDRTQLRSYQRNAESAYAKFYSFCFALVKPPQSRNIDMETATAFWSVILAPKYPIAAELLKFIDEKGTYKAVTKDLWGMTLEFCKTVQPDLTGHDEEEAAWPTLLDDFVEWKKAKATTNTGDAIMSD
ncbi:DCN1-like protein 4 OS=Danio rerio GN=dcun1d4 PE=2 SV=2 [Rhizoctonia solani AG-1 IB]|uniref:Defective in cullin neddylation protein n=1 Tax=Thanatephorus cucumeris (strain AG1-IB / isolate 7/3/14) TaxID=1108050 RepID=A0A0B7F7Q0_THACB|nr:DCN1-like protein 4 OS=Danio rerio GN=dcun1d4 PE=2 SV=2 [Rhizoctonia solani AG-1 IB]